MKIVTLVSVGTRDTDSRACEGVEVDGAWHLSGACVAHCALMVRRARGAGCGSAEGNRSCRAWCLLNRGSYRALVARRAHCADGLAGVRLRSWLACYLCVEAAFRVGAHVASRAVGALHGYAVNVLPSKALHYILALLVQAPEASRALSAHRLPLVRVVARRTLHHVLVWILAVVAGRAQLAVPLPCNRESPWPAHLDGVEALS